MIALHITDLRAFMSAFLLQDLFDRYSLIEAQITTFCTHSIDGRLERAFFADPTRDDDESESARSTVEYVRWNMVKSHCFNIIRGKRTPLFFKFIFFYPPEDLAGFLRLHGISPERASVSGLCLNLRYDGKSLILTTGTSMKTFSMDRSADEAWDAAVRELLNTHRIQYEDA